ncbi:MAG: SufS family cysteine desulfurase [Candidatus Buchananbacteria bacterium]
MSKQNYKKDFPIFKTYPKLVYLDSAATSQKPAVVIQAEIDWYQKYNANVHRGAYALAESATKQYEQSRQIVADFLQAKSAEIVFTKGATEAINLAASAWGLKNLKRGDVILLTEMEHHANLVPWQVVAKITGAKLRFWPINKQGELIWRDLNKLFKNVKLVGVSHISNVLGTINPIAKITKLAHKHRAKVLVDAAQSAGHLPLSVKKLQPDWLVLAGHKMLGPTGIGVLYTKAERYPEMAVYQTGGSMISEVKYFQTKFAKPPTKFEAGTPPLAQAYGLAVAIKYLQKIGLTKIEQHHQELTKCAYKQLLKIPAIKIYGPNFTKRGAVIAFGVAGLHPHDLATWLDGYQVAIRAGHHCAQPLHDQLGVVASARISFHLYNTKSDVVKFIQALKIIIKKWQSSISKK